MSRPNIRFQSPSKEETLFYPTLRKRVYQYFTENNLSRHYNASLVIKTIVLLAAYLLPLAAMMIFQPGLWISLALWAFMGFAMAGVGMCIMHDANHGAYSKSQKVNKILGYTINLCGGTVVNWKLQHNVLHHTYTNITHMDDDIDDQFMLRFSPNTEVKGIQRLQFVYAFILYGFHVMYWVTIKDFSQFFSYITQGVNTNTKKQNLIAFTRIVFTKIMFFSLFLGLPIIVAGLPWLQVVTGFLLMLFICGIILSIVFQLAHTVDETVHPLPDEENTIENAWAVHQLKTTVNFARRSKLISWYVGGLNYQIEHHLFPSISHVHYPKIAPIVKKVAHEFDLEYMEHKTFWQALRSHISALHRFGRQTPYDDIIG